jgi:nitrate reductase gamma subunit
MSTLDHFLFGIYPYICAAVFLFGSLFRFDREQYTWKSDSSQLLRRGQLRLGSNLFHIGVLGLFFGHLVGLLTPSWLYQGLGMSAGTKQDLAIVAGGILGAMALVGIVLLIHRRLTEPRVWATSRPGDLLVLGWILVTLLLGLASIFVSVGHRDGATMTQLAMWAQHLVTFRGGAAQFMDGIHWLYKAHVFLGLTLFLIFPFTRLVHIWSGFATLGYLGRAYQVVRAR